MDVPGFVYVTCPDLKCGVGYFIPRYIYDQARGAGQARVLHCPNGHNWHYTRSIPDELRDKIASLEKEVANQRGARESNWRDYLGAKRLAAYWKGIAHRKES